MHDDDVKNRILQQLTILRRRRLPRGFVITGVMQHPDGVFIDGPHRLTVIFRCDRTPARRRPGRPNRGTIPITVNCPQWRKQERIDNIVAIYRALAQQVAAKIPRT